VNPRREEAMKRTFPAALTTLVLLIVVPLALAADVTRDEYVAKADPICKRNEEANRRIFTGAKQQVKEGELNQASKHFVRAEAALDKTIAQLKAVPRPTADAQRLARWFDYLEVESRYLGRIGKALAEGKKGKAQTLSVRLNRNSNLANNTVLPFGFVYCKIDPEKFN
jgi:hypothetical protein